MKYDVNITYAKFAKQLIYGLLAFALQFGLDFFVSMPPEVQTVELVVLMGVIRGLDNVLKHKD